MSNKAAERTDLLLTLGRLIAPFDELESAQTPASDREYQVAVARFQADLHKWRPSAHAFCCVGGIEFGRELDDMLRPLSSLPDAITKSVRKKPTPELRRQHLRDILIGVKRAVTQTIDSIPIEWEAQLLLEGTPFTCHLRIFDAIRTARTRVHFFDRYLDASVFDLYLRELDRQLQVRLVSSGGGASYGTKVLEAPGQLASKEFRDLQVISCRPSSLHDRNLRIDDTIFFLGPSLKDVGRSPTNFAPTLSTPAAHQVLDTIIRTGQRIV